MSKNIKPPLFSYLLSLTIVSSAKIFSHIFYTTKIKVVGDLPPDWEQTRVFCFLNHTSLFELLFMSAFPFSFIQKKVGHVVIPGADVTLNRPFVGFLFRNLAPNMISISRKRDETWDKILNSITDDNLVAIAPEGRMMRKDGLDKNGNPMSIRGGIADILQAIPNGKMLVAYSGGLHHVQVPGQKLPRLFKTILINLEWVDITKYKDNFPQEPKKFKVAVIKDLEDRLKQHKPVSK